MAFSYKSIRLGRYMRAALASALLSLYITDGYAVPAKPGLMTVLQADGTELTVRLVGDERSHYYLSEDGYLLVNAGEMFYYANADSRGNIVRSDIVARPAAKRSPSARRYLESVRMDAVMAALKERNGNIVSRYDRSSSMRPTTGGPAKSAAADNGPMRSVGLFDTGFPSKGVQKGLVVLVEYKDVKFNTQSPGDYFSRMLNEDGFSDNGGTGCAAEYFRESSKGQFRPEFDVYGPVTLSQNMSYYGANDYSGNDKNPEQMVIEACQQLDGTIDFSEYDRDGDGFIDNVFVFYAGRGEASGGSANTVWPHSWNIMSATEVPYIFDGVRLDRYACSNEWEGGRPDGIGTFVHEFSHVMGLPDLYATSYTSAFTPGSWSVLDSGPYNNGGCTPPLYSVYERYALGWLKPVVIDGPASVTLRDIGTNTACIIPTDNPNEFFLLENRQQKGWDRYIPGHGMLVWHVDYNENVWNSNVVNNTPSHQYVDIEEADNSRSEYSRAGDAFPGTAGVTSFTDDTTPSMRTWGGKRLGLPLTDIAETDSIITFNVAGGKIVTAPVVATAATEIGAVSFTANWEPAADISSYKISVYTKNETESGRVQTEPVAGYTMRETDGIRCTLVEGLEPLSEYFYVIYAVGAGGISEASNEISVTTGEPTFDVLKPGGLAATDITDSSFTASWNPVEGAMGYDIDVYMKVLGDAWTDTVNFDAGVRNLPEGWKTNSTLSYANTAYSGAAIPSLRFAAAGGYIESPVYTADVRSLTFWHRGAQTTDDNRIVVVVRDSRGAWTDFAAYPVTNEAGGTTITIDSLPAGTRVVRISYDLKTKGSLAVDDIVVGWGGDVVLSGETFRLDYAGTSMPVTGLRPATEYFFRVSATDGVLTTRRSDELGVVTLPASVGSGIAAASTAGRALTLSGRTLSAVSGTDVRLTVTDMSGRVLFSGCPSSVTLPAAGFYIVSVGGERCKIAVR